MPQRPPPPALSPNAPQPAGRAVVQARPAPAPPSPHRPAAPPVAGGAAAPSCTTPSQRHCRVHPRLPLPRESLGRGTLG